MTKWLTCIIPALNCPDEVKTTVEHIRRTAGDGPEIIVVDDASNPPIPPFSPSLSVLLLRNPERVGVAGSRDVGIRLSQTPVSLLMDAHMNFAPGWYEAAEAVCLRPDRDETIHCARCLHLVNNHTSADLTNGWQQVYDGATWNFYGPDRNAHHRTQLFEVIWKDPENGDDLEIPAVMGACYFVPRLWYVRRRGLERLKYWGGDEALLSLLAWLAGGGIRLEKTIQIGHVWFDPPARKFGVPIWAPWYNKFFVMRTMLPPKVAHILEAKAPRTPPVLQARRLLDRAANAVHHQRDIFEIYRTREFGWYLKRFNLKCPGV